LQVKNVGSDELAGKVGRIYMPQQDIGSMALHKMKVRPLIATSVIIFVCIGRIADCAWRVEAARLDAGGGTSTAPGAVDQARQLAEPRSQKLY